MTSKKSVPAKKPPTKPTPTQISKAVAAKPAAKAPAPKPPKAAIPPPRLVPPSSGVVVLAQGLAQAGAKLVVPPEHPPLLVLPVAPAAPVLPSFPAGVAQAALAPVAPPPIVAPLAPAVVVTKKPRKSKNAPQSNLGALPMPAVPATPVAPPVAAVRTVLPPFTQLATNLKGRRPDENVPLAPVTVIYSKDNRAGKTAVLDGYRLALSGKHPVGKDFADLCELTADGEAPLAGIMSATGGASFYVPSGKRSGLHAGVGTMEQLVGKEAACSPLDLSEDGSLLTLSSEKLREALFARWGAVVTADAAVLAGPLWLNDGKKEDGKDGPQVKVWVKLMGPEVGRPVVERLADALQQCKQEVRDLQGAVRVANATAEEQGIRVQAAGALPPAAVAALEAELTACGAAEKMGGLRFELQAAQGELAGVAGAVLSTGERAALASRYAELAAWGIQAQAYFTAQGMKAAPHPHAALRGTLTAGQACPVCEQPVTPATLALLNPEPPEVQAGRAQLEQSSAEATAIAAKVTASDAAYAKGLELQERIARLTAALGPGLGVVKTKEEIATLKAKLVVQQAQLNLQKEWDATKNRAVTHEIKIELMKRLTDEVKTRLDTLVRQVADAAVAACSVFLPEGFALQVITQDRERAPTCEWRIRGRDQSWHRYSTASGVERATARVAVACACGQAQPFRALLLDDAELSSPNDEVLVAVLNAAQDARTKGWLDQVLVATSRSAAAEWAQGLASSEVGLVSI